MRRAIVRWSRRPKPRKQPRRPVQCGFAEAVARYLFKLMAYKDEYEVARLYTDGNFLKQVASTFDGKDLRFEFHLAPPLLAKPDPATGVPRKMSFGPWMMRAFGVLAKLKFLRGTPFDPFGYSQERRTERKLIADYEAHAGRGDGQAHARQSPAGRGARRDPREDPWLRPRQGAAPRRPPRPTKRRCWSSSAPASRRCSRPRNSRLLIPRTGLAVSLTGL